MNNTYLISIYFFQFLKQIILICQWSEALGYDERQRPHRHTVDLNVASSQPPMRWALEAAVFMRKSTSLLRRPLKPPAENVAMLLQQPVKYVVKYQAFKSLKRGRLGPSRPPIHSGLKIQKKNPKP